MPFTVATDDCAAVMPKAFFGVVTVALTLTAYGCDANRVPPPAPLSPSPVPDQTTLRPTVEAFPFPPGEMWRLTTTIVSLEGSVCFWTWPIGKKFDWTLLVDRSGAQVRFIYDPHNPHDNLLFVGTVNDRSFTAASETYHSHWGCSGSATLFSSVVGNFSPDGRRLSGHERLTYRVDRGGELTITFEWDATPSEESRIR